MRLELLFLLVALFSVSTSLCLMDISRFSDEEKADVLLQKGRDGGTREGTRAAFIT